MPTPTASDEPLLIGGRYRILRQLGEGGMGTVHEAIQEGLGRRVAVKLLHPGRVASERQRARFRREAETVAQLLHPNLVQVTDFGIDGDKPFMVMEYLEGESLRGYLERVGTLGPARAVTIALSVLAALRAVHAAGVVHRDIKPGNIFIVWDDDGQPIPKLLDFGIASGRYRDDSDSDELDGESEQVLPLPAHETERLTRTDSVFGTIAYMAPEQVRSAKLAGPAADQYAIGVVLYECLSGRLPHEGDSAAMMSVAKLRHAPPDIGELCVGLPETLRAVIMRVLSTDASARYEDVSALRAALSSTLDGAADGAAVGAAHRSEGEAPAATAKKTLSVPTQQATEERAVLDAGDDLPTVTTAQLETLDEPAPLPNTAAPLEEPAAHPRRAWLAAVMAVGVGVVVAVAFAVVPDGPSATSGAAGGHHPSEKARDVAPLKSGPAVPPAAAADVRIGAPEAGEPTEVPDEEPSPPAAPSAPSPARAPRTVTPRDTPPQTHAASASRRSITVAGYDEWTAAVHLDAASARIDRCVASGAVPVAASARVQLRIDDDGAAHACRSSGVEGTFGTCVCGALRALNWSPPPGGSADVGVVFGFE